MVTLTDQERAKFAAYLEQDAAATDGLVKQLGNLGANPATDMLTKKMKAEATAARIVAAKLRSIETDTVG